MSSTLVQSGSSAMYIDGLKRLRHGVLFIILSDILITIAIIGLALTVFAWIISFFMEVVVFTSLRGLSLEFLKKH